MIMKVDSRPSGTETEHLWSFSLTDQEMYEVICNQIAWRIISTTKRDQEWVKDQTVQIVRECHQPGDTNPVEEVRDPFIRLVLSEVKRLGIPLGETK